MENAAKVRDIRDWLKRYATYSEKLFKSGRTLDDQQQSPLFLGKDIELHAAQPARQDSTMSGVLEIFDKTGFICRSVVWTKSSRADAKDDDRAAAASDVGGDGALYDMLGKFTFLSDWERLWNYLADEDSDEIAVHLPFLRAGMEFVFHRRMVQMAYVLFCWNMTLLFCLQGGFSKEISNNVYQNAYLNCVFEFVVYLLVCAMVQGPSATLFFDRRDNANRRGNAASAARSQSRGGPSVDSVSPSVGLEEEREIAQEAVDQTFPMANTFNRLWRRGKRELHSSLFGRRTYIKATKADGAQSLYFYRWLNMAIKVLTRDYGVDIAQINFNRSSYRFMLLFTFLGYPAYVVIMFYVKVSMLLGDFCSASSSAYYAPACHFYSIQLIASIFGVTLVIQQFLYGASVLLSLTGLAYGCEIAFRLSESWTQKFHSLRRVAVPGGRNGSRGKCNDGDGVDSGDNEERNASHRSSDAWALQARPLHLPAQGDVVAGIISRDATEHYLFVCALLRRAGELWSPVLLLYLFLAVYMALSNVLIVLQIARTTTTFGNVLWVINLIVYLVIRVLVLLCFPVLAIAFANSYFLKMYDVFRVADDADYALIGGRNRWLRIFTESPAAWTFFGLGITPERLFAVLWTSLVALGGIFLSAIIGNSRV